MRTARFWTGLIILAGLATAIVLAIPGRQAAPGGPVEGTVVFHGRPLSGGTIFFSPEAWEDGEGTVARIDKNGHFECNPQWRRDRAPWMRFRIDIMMAPNKVSREPSPDDRGEIPETRDDDDTDPRRGGGRRPTRRILRATLQSRVQPSLGRPDESGRQRRTGVSRIIQREVWLDREPTHLDIDLSD